MTLTETGETTPYGSTMQAYTDEQYRAMLLGAGFAEIIHADGMGDAGGEFAGKLKIVIGTKRA